MTLSRALRNHCSEEFNARIAELEPAMNTTERYIKSLSAKYACAALLGHLEAIEAYENAGRTHPAQWPLWAEEELGKLADAMGFTIQAKRIVFPVAAAREAVEGKNGVLK